MKGSICRLYTEYLATCVQLLPPLCFVAVRPLRWRHNELDGVSDHQPHDCLLNRLFGRRSKKTSKLRVTGLYAGNSPGIGEFPAQKASNAENASIWWRHHASAGFPHVFQDNVIGYGQPYDCLNVSNSIVHNQYGNWFTWLQHKELHNKKRHKPQQIRCIFYRYTVASLFTGHVGVRCLVNIECAVNDIRNLIG